MKFKISRESITSLFGEMTKTKKRVFLTGFFFSFLIVLHEVSGLVHNNFQIFSYGSLDFWAGINPYADWHHLSLQGKPLDLFLYGPLFSILFTPFALLPGWLGAITWNFFTYSLFFFSIFTLPEQFSFYKKKFIFFFSVLTLFCTLLSLQFNPVIAALFLFSFTLLEKNKGFWAVLLILLSTFTKVYGIFQLAMLFFYPNFRKNILYVALIGTTFLLIPLINIQLNELPAYYHSWIITVMEHSDASRFYSIYRPVILLFRPIEPFMGFISLGIFLTLFSISLTKLELFRKSFSYRAQFLGIIMAWVILFGLSSERHTYVIALVGYAIWYLNSVTGKFDKVILWINFVLLGIMPVDIICPMFISSFVLGKLHMGVIFFAFTWFTMVYKTFASPQMKE